MLLAAIVRSPGVLAHVILPRHADAEFQLTQVLLADRNRIGGSRASARIRRIAAGEVQ